MAPRGGDTVATHNDIIAEITRLEGMRAIAIVKADRVTLDAITSTDYLHVDSAGRVRDKTEFLCDVKGEGGHFAAYRVSDNRVSVFGSTVVVTGMFENRWQAAGGGETIKRARHVRIYVRIKGAWQNIHHQATEIRDEQDRSKPR
jgi:hypothetical protein